MNDETVTQSETQQEPQQNPRKKLLLCDIALIIEGAATIAIVSFPVWGFLFFVPFIQILAIILGIGVICAPLIGVILGVISLCYHSRNKHNIACSVLAIAIPIVAVLTIIILCSARVIVIRFM